MSSAPSQPTNGEPALEDALMRNVRTVGGRVLAAALAVVILVTALVLVWRQYEDAKRKAEDELRARAILAATVFDTYFAGQIATLSAIAASPSVMAGDERRMAAYFAQFRPRQGSVFTAGVGWIDRTGRQRATSDPRGPTAVSLADRSYFRVPLATKQPFVSEAIIARTTQRRLVVMSVPTRDSSGRVTGVLAGGIVLPRSRNDARANDLGYAGLQVIDRNGQQITRRDLARPANADLVAQLREAKAGILDDSRGLDGSNGRVVAFASSAAPQWLTVIDQPASTVFADARRSLLLEALLLAAATVVVLLLVAWAYRRTLRDVRANRTRVSRWAHVTQLLNEATDQREVGEVLSNALASEFPGGLTIVVLGALGDASPRSASVVNGRQSPLAPIDEATAFSIAAALAAADVPVVLETEAELRQRIALAAPARPRSLYGAALQDEGGRPVGIVALLFAAEHALDSAEVALVQAHASQAAHALGRVRRHQLEHEAALLLQQSLLPQNLLQTEGVKAAAHYRAGVTYTEAGGDWFDAVRRADGIVHFTVGDVAGRGIDAAVSMGELRTAFRAYAYDYSSPADVVRRMARHVQQDSMATTVCVTYDPYADELAYATAGHLPPLLIDVDARSVTRLDHGGGPPLGWRPENVAVQHADVPNRAILALYTDGLVEHRGSDLDTGIDRLAEAILEASPADLAQTLDAVVDGVVDEPVDDDVALLLVALEGPPSVMSLEIPADPGLLRELRRRVRLWLERRGLDRSAREDAVLALSEACNNAIEHGYRHGSGTIRLQLEHAGDALKIEVADEGEWREPGPDTDRGRGISIMRGLMDVAEIVHSPQGTEVLLEQRLSRTGLRPSSGNGAPNDGRSPSSSR